MSELRFERDGHGVVGRGIRCRIPLPHGYGAPDAWNRVRDLLAPGEVAMGALPFDSAAPTELIVPAEVERGALSEPVPRPDDKGPDGFTLTSVRPHAEFLALIENAVDSIAAGAFEKVVLAREVIVEANRAIVIDDVLDRLRHLYPSCMVFSVEGFVGASPELLVERRGDRVTSHPLAGTFPRSGDSEADERLAEELLVSDKDRREHRYVVDAVARALEPLCEELSVPEVPAIVQLRNVVHLGTRIEGRMTERRPSALELVAAIAPTPAVGGTPREPALEFVAGHEGFDRGRYGGPVGWVDADGDGQFAIGIRCADIEGHRARLVAGVGVVKGSIPAAELAETQLKLQALLSAVVRP